jgi:hypothetical protein
MKAFDSLPSQSSSQRERQPFGNRERTVTHVSDADCYPCPGSHLGGRNDERRVVREDPGGVKNVIQRADVGPKRRAADGQVKASDRCSERRNVSGLASAAQSTSRAVRDGRASPSLET